MKFPDFASMILFETSDLVVVNKPPFLASLDERNTSEPSLLRLAKQVDPALQLCHRLDKETSGALVIAKNPETYRWVSIQFERRKVTKVYHAIIEGNHQFQKLDITLPILNAGKEKVRISRQDGKRAETVFQSLQFFKHYTLVECRPLTGRMHQIRIHLASQRAVIAGDTNYGGKPPMLSTIKSGYRLSKNAEELPIMKRFALHSHQIAFDGPSGKRVDVEAPYAKDFGAFITLLNRYDQ